MGLCKALSVQDPSWGDTAQERTAEVSSPSGHCVVCLQGYGLQKVREDSDRAPGPLPAKHRRPGTVLGDRVHNAAGRATSTAGRPESCSFSPHPQAVHTPHSLPCHSPLQGWPEPDTPCLNPALCLWGRVPATILRAPGVGVTHGWRRGLAGGGRSCENVGVVP